MTMLADWIEFNPRVQLEKDKSYPFISMDVLTPGSRYVKAGEARKFIGGGTKFRSGDTLFARITPCLENGKISQFVDESAENGAFGSTEFFVLRAIPGKSTPAFVYYLSQTSLLRDTAVKSMVGASGRQRADISVLRELEIEAPDLDIQEKVTEVLSAYDDLIATNQRRIALLEDAAHRLYREWFVHLRFPGHESVPVKDGVPEGWCKKPIAEQTSFLNRGITPKYDDTAKGWVINQKCIRDGRISMEPARRQSKDVKPERLIRTGDVLINSTGAGTLGRVAQVRAPIENCTVDTHVTIARPLDEGSSTYFGQALLELAPVFSEMGKGATNQLELSRSDIGAVEVWHPPQHLHVEFHRLVGPMLEQAEQLSVANLSLEKTRDLLLPKLMSGQLDVSGIALPDEVAA